MVAFTFVPEKMDTSLYNALRSGFYARQEGSTTVMLDDSIGTVRWDTAVDRGQLFISVLSSNGVHKIPIYRVSGM
jgi:hypothetical protein